MDSIAYKFNKCGRCNGKGVARVFTTQIDCPKCKGIRIIWSKVSINYDPPRKYKENINGNE